MSSYKPGDSKREEFRKYLERAGVLDALTKVLVGLYEEPEKPGDALEYLKKQLGVGPEVVDADALRQEVEDLREKLSALTMENNHLKQKLALYEEDEGQLTTAIESPPPDN